ncbi:hypothetical protein DLE60_34560 [Micromonospora globispora]|uniref:Nucleotidyl transferase AbiEii/AbiGii toxin family protein n=1 Tax=Micromonospora globispora TaxID=1450148 RepID=A0A317K064_9ACTN|nr:nucleotidyl transferase AbiEii/AbiGii toxin family protein [Micromonospora globispora]PWU46467.1 hypothetical protein DLJ46_17800 [Micromonospora globispora]PWU48122.1 hypothetical protein DLE60_34560 [Micromonospora globispora]
MDGAGGALTGGPAWQDARRAALDHVLGLVAEAPCGDELVLRGSMSMLAWAPNLAREPGDIDWVVRPPAVTAYDEAYPFPYLDRLDPVQTWPEATHGAARNEIWTFEEFDTGGHRPRLPPEGLHWARPEELDPPSRPHLLVIDLVREDPVAYRGVTFQPDAATVDSTWGYSYDTTADGAGGARLHLPWRADGDLTGSIQLDFAYDERLPDAASLIAVPRLYGSPPTVVWGATPQLSLLWKLQWLCVDHETYGSCQGKDLFDAVLLAELNGVTLSGRLVSELLHRVPRPENLRPDAILRWQVDGPTVPDETTTDWLERLASAVGAMPALMSRIS